MTNIEPINTDKQEPSFTIDHEGNVILHSMNVTDASLTFWEAVQKDGNRYRDQIAKLQLAVAALTADPYRSAVHDGYAVWNKISREVRQNLTFMELTAVLDAIEAVAKREVH